MAVTLFMRIPELTPERYGRWLRTSGWMRTRPPA